jgi:hypothetical protein
MEQAAHHVSVWCHALSNVWWVQVWLGLRWGIKRGSAGPGTDLMVQLDSTAGVVVPVGKLSDLISSRLPPGTSPALLCTDKKRRAEVEEGVKGVQVRGPPSGCQPSAMMGLSTATVALPTRHVEQ